MGATWRQHFSSMLVNRNGRTSACFVSPRTVNHEPLQNALHGTMICGEDSTTGRQIAER